MDALRSLNAATCLETSDLMSGFARIDQGYVEVLGPDEGNARVDQGYIEVLGALKGSGEHARIDQAYVEVLGKITGADKDAKVDQAYVEVLGVLGTPPVPGYSETDEQWFNI